MDEKGGFVTFGSPSQVKLLQFGGSFGKQPISDPNDARGQSFGGQDCWVKGLAKGGPIASEGVFQF
jgi:hypothetical protein